SVRATGGSALELDVDVELSLASDGTSLEASGSLLGGELSLAGQRDGTGAWTGQVELTGAGLPAGNPTAALVATGVLRANHALARAVLGPAIYGSGPGSAAVG